MRRYSSGPMTSGAGFVGSYIVVRLLSNGSVTVIDNLSTGRLENLTHHKGKNRGDKGDFIDAQDTVCANMFGLAIKGFNQASNVVTGAATTVNQQADILQEIMDEIRSKPAHINSRMGEIRYSYTDVSRAGKFLSLNSKVPLKDSLAELFERYTLKQN